MSITQKEFVAASAQAAKNQINADANLTPAAKATVCAQIDALPIANPPGTAAVYVNVTYDPGPVLTVATRLLPAFG